MHLISENPATGERLQTYPQDTDSEVESRIQAAATGFKEWRETNFAQRGEWIRGVGTALRNRTPELARLITLEMGKPIRQSEAEITKCAVACEYFADHAARFLEPDEVPTEASRSQVCYLPLGVILAVMPWNFPFWQVIRCAAPALMAGNTVLLKHASNVTGCALALAEVFESAGLPGGTFSVLRMDSSRVAALLNHSVIKAVALTGSTEAGRSIGSAAGRALKKTVLELGGSDPYLILEDADLEVASRICAEARLINGGQSCIAAKRFIVVESVRKPFEELMLERLRAQKMGDPLDPATDVGPLARTSLRDELQRQVEDSISLGAQCGLGGRVPEGRGGFYPPTLLTSVTPGMPVFDEETFGPVAAIVPADSEATAVSLANRSAFGLGAAVFTRNIARGEEIAVRDLEAGTCCVNTSVKSDPRLPFGGIKDSGYGRELAAVGLREFVNIKTVNIG